jgi:hypothetical protein
VKGIIIFGGIIALFGLITFVIPSFNTEQTKDVAKLGDLKLQTKSEQTHFIPPMLSEGAIALGLLMVGAGLLTGRQS